MKTPIQSVTVRIQKLFSQKSAPKTTDRDRLRESARATLKKYHKTFRKLAHE